MTAAAPAGAPAERFARTRAILFDAGGTLIHLAGERICRAAGVPFSASAFARAEAGAGFEMRDRILAQPGATDAERVPLYFEAILRRLRLDGSEARAAAVRAIGEEHHRANIWSRPGEGASDTLRPLLARIPARRRLERRRTGPPTPARGGACRAARSGGRLG